MPKRIEKVIKAKADYTPDSIVKGLLMYVI